MTTESPIASAPRVLAPSPPARSCLRGLADELADAPAATVLAQLVSASIEDLSLTPAHEFFARF